MSDVTFISSKWKVKTWPSPWMFVNAFGDNQGNMGEMSNNLSWMHHCPAAGRPSLGPHPVLIDISSALQTKLTKGKKRTHKIQLNRFKQGANLRIWRACPLRQLGANMSISNIHYCLSVELLFFFWCFVSILVGCLFCFFWKTTLFQMCTRLLW